MNTVVYETSDIQRFLKRHLVGTLPELKRLIGTPSTMTVFRKLKALGYRTSYSDRGQYYTLSEIPQFDDRGLWTCRQAWFSRYGNLRQTVRALVEDCPQGWTAQELDNHVHVPTKQPLLDLVRLQKLVREKIDGLYVYFSGDKARQRSQRLHRNTFASTGEEGMLATPEMKAAIILFYSLLNEKQRRLYAGLESLRQGRGGDCAIATLLGLDNHTVAKGRRELFGGQVLRDRVRRQGAGRKAVEKKRPTSSGKSGNCFGMTPLATP